MKCKTIKEKFVDYLTGELDDVSKEEVQGHVGACPSCREELESLSEIWTKLGVLPEEQPSTTLRSRFYAMLEAYKQGLKRERPAASWHRILESWFARSWPRRPAFQFALSLAFLLVGLTAGYILNSNGKRVSEMTQLSQEFQAMRQTLALSLLEQASPTERLRGVSLSYEMEKPSEKILETLLYTLNNDPNNNVRLAAVDALYLFYNNPTVKEGLIHSLSKQTSPLVQVALIDLIVNMRERRAIDSLKQLIEDEKFNPDVRRRAEQGLQKLNY
jgi:hypothetical protein